MRLPDTAHTSRPWRIHEFTPEFRLEDVWALPTPGGPDDFPRLVRLITAGNASRDSKGAARALWVIRLKLGEILGWDASPGSDRPSLRGRLPADLRDLPPGLDFPALPFTPLYLTADEFAAEIINRTVHGVLHLGWVRDDADNADKETQTTQTAQGATTASSPFWSSRTACSAPAIWPPSRRSGT